MFGKKLFGRLPQLWKLLGLHAVGDRSEQIAEHIDVSSSSRHRQILHKETVDDRQRDPVRILIRSQQLQHFGGVQPRVIMPAIVGPVYGYRTRARLGVKFVAKKGGILVGFREKDPRYLANLDHCDILHPSVGNLIKPLKETLILLTKFFL